MRSAGISIAVDFTPQWAEHSMGHTWSALLTNEKKYRRVRQFYGRRARFFCVIHGKTSLYIPA